MINQEKTLSGKMNELKKQGYTLEFDIKDNAIHTVDKSHTFAADEFTIDHVYRFEGLANPADNSILYAVTTTTDKKGLIIGPYGTYGEEVGDKIIQKLKERH
ncbi:hypothetical protein GCM10009117_23350 [Gangjinia marincola]|uniref:Phosphoribosylpyrophosphate synthetase n=1 Tax=Gangjinia marincola TaxID=578463 RepID=A0ABN1MJ62_9FLAO